MRPVIHRTAIVSLWILGGLVVLSVVLGSLLFWRLSAGPMSLSFLTPYLEDALTASLAGRSVDVQDTILAMDVAGRSMDLRARDVTIRDADDVILATLPAIDVRLSLQALFGGTVALTAIDIEAARVTLTRASDGAILFGTAGEQDIESQSQILSDMVHDLMSEPDSSRPLAALQEVRLVNGGLTVQDMLLGITWEASQADMTLRRDQNGFTVQLDVTTILQDNRAIVNAKLSYNRSREWLELNASFTNLRPPTLATVVPTLDTLAGLDVPFNGSFSLTFDRQGDVHDLSFDLTGGPGTLSYPDVLPQPQPISVVTARGRLDAERGTFQLDDATITVGPADAAGPQLSIHGSAEGLGSKDTTSGLTGQLQGTLAVQDRRTTFETEMSYNPSSTQLSLNTSFTNLLPPLLAATVPPLHALAGFDVPFSGSLALVLDQLASVQKLTFKLSGGPGRLVYADVLPEPLQVSRITAHGRLDGEQGVLQLDNATMAVGKGEKAGPILKLSGKARGLGSDITITGQAALQALPIAELHDYWPLGVSPTTRAWLTENLAAGTVEQAQVDVVLALPAASSAIKVKRLDGTLQYHDFEVHYLRPLPPVIGVTGAGRFDLQGFLLQVETGRTAGQTITGGEVQITGLDSGRDAIAIKVGLEGPIREALHLLDHPRLNVLSGMPIEPAATGGQAAVQTMFAFSLRGGIQLENVDIEVQGRLHDVSMQRVFLDQDAEHGSLELALDKQGMRLKGKADFAAVPLTLDWQEAFTKEASWRSKIHIVAPRVREANLAHFGLDLTRFVTGPFAAEIIAKIGWKGRSMVNAALNLEETALVLPFLGWRKAAGEPGEAHGTLQLVDNRPTTLRDMDIAAGTLSASGIAQFNQVGSGITSIEVKDLTFGNSNLSAVSAQRRGESFDILIGEGVLDAQPLVQRNADAEQSRAKGMEGGPRLHLHAPALRQVSFGPDRYLQQVQVELTRGKTGWELIDIVGQVPTSLLQRTTAEKREPIPLSVQYQPTPQGPYALSVHTEDVGATLRALNVSDNVIGGRLAIEGTTVGPEPDGPIQATIETKDFVMQDAPVLARILAAASLPGLLNHMTNKGLKFSRLSGELGWKNGTLAVERLNAYGGSLGLTAKGAIDLDAKDVQLRGTIIPAYGLNSLLGKIPVINLLVGGKDQGLVAINYRLSGRLPDPQVTVNPASALTPGFLRKMFDLFDDSKINDGEVPPSDIPSATEELQMGH